MHAAASSSGVPALPPHHLPQHGQALGPAFDRRQLRHPQAPQGARLAWPPSPLDFTPTSASWLNAVEGFFAKLTRRRLKRGVFRSIFDLQIAINRFVEETNAHPKPFSWTADPDRVIAAVKRGKQALESIH